MISGLVVRINEKIVRLCAGWRDKIEVNAEINKFLVNVSRGRYIKRFSVRAHRGTDVCETFISAKSL